MQHAHFTMHFFCQKSIKIVILENTLEIFIKSKFLMFLNLCTSLKTKNKLSGKVCTCKSSITRFLKVFRSYGNQKYKKHKFEIKTKISIV